MADRIDFEAEGLLAGLEGEERDSRRELLERLSGDGVELKELRRAVAEGRLAVLPVERLLAGEPRHSIDEVAERSGVPAEVLERQWRSIGLALPDRDEAILTGDDLESAHRLRTMLDAGISPEAMAELSRTIAVAMSSFAAASRQVMASSFVNDEDLEGEVSERMIDRTRVLVPLVGPTLDYVYRVHMREQLRHAAFATEVVGEAGGGSALSTIAFADLVGFTRLGEELPPEELGRVTGRLDELAREVAHGPVRLVKLIGDAAMLASPDTAALLEAIHDLLDGMSREEDDLPLIRAGVARGAVVTRGGDFYGGPVNLASRITGAARPGSVLVEDEVREEVPDGYRYSRAGRKHLKGIKGTVEVFRCRRLDEAEDE